MRLVALIPRWRLSVSADRGDVARSSLEHQAAGAALKPCQYRDFVQCFKRRNLAKRTPRFAQRKCAFVVSFGMKPSLEPVLLIAAKNVSNHCCLPGRTPPLN